MKQTVLVLAVLTAVGLSACSSTSAPGLNPGNVTAVKEQRLSTDFKEEGIRVTYTFTGEVEKVEAFGYAEVWRGQYQHVAEADAKDKLVKFLHGESVSTSRKTQVIAKSIDRAQDNTINKFKTIDGAINFTDTDLEKVESQANVVPSSDENSKSNTALRKASVNNAQIVTSTITISSKGILQGVYRERTESINDNKTFVAVYVWSPKGQKVANDVKKLMGIR